MPDPISPILAAGLVVGGLKAASGIGAGIGQARAGKKMMLTETQQKELEELQRRKARNELGLTERELGSIEARFLAEQAGAQRELEAAALQQAAARGLGGSVSGRDVFLQEMAQVQAEQNLRQQQNIFLTETDRAAAAAEEARIDAMVMQQKEAEAMRAQGIANIFSLGFAGAGEGASEAFAMRNKLDIARIEAAAKSKSPKELEEEVKVGEEAPLGTSV
jgi:hypothetical protein